MKNKTVESEKRNIFGIIKESVFGSLVDFFKSLSSTEIDEAQDEVVSPEAKAEVSKIERTTFDNDDVIEVEAGKTANFGGLNAYKRNVDVNEALKAHEAKVQKQEKNKEPESIERGND